MLRGGGLLANGRQEVKKAGISSNVIAHLLRNLGFVLKRSFLGYGVIIWQVFIRILRYNGSKAVGRIVKISPLLGEEFIRGQEVRQARGQACFEDRKVRRYEGRLFTVKSLSSYPPTLLSSDNDPLPSPPPREGACSCKTNLQSNNCHCERQNGASQSHNLCNINEITTSNALHSPRNDIENLCNTQYGGLSGTLSYNDIESSCNTQCDGWNGYVLPQSLPQGREAEKSTSRFTLHTSLKKRAAFTLAEGATHVPPLRWLKF